METVNRILQEKITCLLYTSGATEKCGRVDTGDTITDSMDLEKRRGITVRASTTSIIWNGVKCNIIDTPGHLSLIHIYTGVIQRRRTRHVFRGAGADTNVGYGM